MIYHSPAIANRIDPFYHQHVDLMGLLLTDKRPPARDYVLMEAVTDEWNHRAVIWQGWKFVFGGRRGSPSPYLYSSDSRGINESASLLIGGASPRVLGIADHLAAKLPPFLPYTPKEEQAIADRMEALGYE